METNRTPEQVMLAARLQYHIREFNTSVLSSLSSVTSRLHWTNYTTLRNHSVDRANTEFHFEKVHQLSEEWMDSTGERFPLPIFLECTPGEYTKKGESILVGKVANSENPG